MMDEKIDLSLDSILKSRTLSDREFEKISAKILQLCGINLHDGKKELVQARLNKRLRALGFDKYKDYLKFVEEDPTGHELTMMVDSLTTNLTFFFRENDHFEYLRDEILRKHDTSVGSRLRIWSAGCSSGEEPYSIAITLREAVSCVDLMDARILATDLSTKVLAMAKAGAYTPLRFKDTPKYTVDKYFEPTIVSGEKSYCARPELKRLIAFRKLNLMEQWPMSGPFDVIFCRNVMIYFDKKTQGELVRRFYDILRPGGTFMVGHSESLTGISHNFRYIRPSIYAKP